MEDDEDVVVVRVVSVRFDGHFDLSLVGCMWIDMKHSMSGVEEFD